MTPLGDIPFMLARCGGVFALGALLALV